MRNQYFRSKDESSLEARFKEQQDQTAVLDETVTTQSEDLSQITNNGAITGFVVLTQTAYDALPAGKLTDGKVYMIAGA